MNAIGKEKRIPRNAPRHMNWDIRASAPEKTLERLVEISKTAGRMPKMSPSGPL
jgi:hypothetical protein